MPRWEISNYGVLIEHPSKYLDIYPVALEIQVGIATPESRQVLHQYATVRVCVCVYGRPLNITGIYIPVLHNIT